MCGICGQLRFDNQAVKTSAINKMMAKIARRGTDDSGQWVEGNIGFGHQRLSIIDLSKKAHQPMVDEALGLVLVFNGTIYNYQQLRQNLLTKGYDFFSHSDTEVILKAYHYWGDDCVAHFDGMFAFCLWDKSQQHLFIARDRLGIKPFYYHLSDKAFTFASNTQALLTQNQIDISINPIALQHQLSLHGVVPAPNTILNGIQKLSPATILHIYPNGKSREQIYWQPKAEKNNLTDADNIEKTKELLINALNKRMSATDVPIGVLLSGGLDSSLLVGLLSLSGHKNIRTFSIGFEDVADEAGAEFEYSDKIQAQFQTTHQKYHINNSQLLPRLEEVVANMAEPMVGVDAIGFYLLSEQVAKQLKVVVSGQGADEAFAGYFWYQRMQNEKGSAYQKFAKHYLDRPYEEYLQTVNDYYQQDNFTKIWLDEEFMRSGADEFMSSVFRLDITRLLVDDPIKRVDNMTMAWGLEARVPFMDTALIEHALSLPLDLKMRQGGKYPLKQISRGLLPDSVIDRKKGYFPMPALNQSQGDFRTFMLDILNTTACKNRGIFARNYVQKVINQPQNYRTALNGSRLWHLALLEYWLQINVDN